MARTKSMQFSAEVEAAFRVIEAAAKTATRASATANDPADWHYAISNACRLSEGDERGRRHLDIALEELGVMTTPELVNALVVVGDVLVPAWRRRDEACQALLGETQLTPASRAEHSLRRSLEDTLTTAQDWELALRRALRRPKRTTVVI